MLSKEQKYLSGKDAHLAKIIQAIPLTVIESSKQVFYDLVSCIVGQQIHYRRVVPVFKKFIDLLPYQIPTPENISQIDEHAFLSLKISKSKYETLLMLSEYWIENKMDDYDWQKSEVEEIRKIFSNIKGVGNWTVDMILLYTLQKPDIFPFDDYHLKDIMVKLYNLNPDSKLKAQMLEVADEWSPYKSLAVKYLLDWKEINKKQTDESIRLS